MKIRSAMTIALVCGFFLGLSVILSLWATCVCALAAVFVLGFAEGACESHHDSMKEVKP